MQISEIKSFKEQGKESKLKRVRTKKRNKEVLDSLSIKYLENKSDNQLEIQTPVGKVFFTLSTGWIHVCETKESLRGIRTLLQLLMISQTTIDNLFNT